MSGASAGSPVLGMEPVMSAPMWNQWMPGLPETSARFSSSQPSSSEATACEMHTTPWACTSVLTHGVCAALTACEKNCGALMGSRS